MTLSRTLAERGEYEQALTTLKTVLALQNPISAAEAQFRIGEVHEKMIEARTATATSSKWTASGLSAATLQQQQMGPAIQAYTATFEKYPESPFAANAIERVARHYADSQDFAQALNLFEKVASDYPDAEFMDDILFAWGTIAIQMNDEALAKEKMSQLLYNYPGSKHASEARSVLGALESSTTATGATP
jgi:TolA-binding protein